MFLLEKHRFAVLDSWRGLCALCVAVFHFRNNVESHIQGLPFFTNSYLFVDFFFVLSGFIIFANYEQKLREGYSLRSFVMLRFGRLYPLHAFVLLGLMGLEILQVVVPQLQGFGKYGPFQGPDSLPHMIPPNLLMLHAMGFTERLSFNGPSWSIGAEFYAYIFFAMLIIIFRQRVGRVLPLVMLVSGFMLFKNDLYLTTTFEWGWARCVYSFALGGLVWRFYDKYNAEIKNDRISWSILELIMFCAVLAGVSLAGTGPMSMVMPFLFAWTILIFAFEGGIISRLLSLRIFLIVGALSYSIYMLHAPIASKFDALIKALKLEDADIWTGDAILLSFLAVTLVAATLTYHCVERPGREYFRKLARHPFFANTKIRKKVGKYSG